MMLAMGPKPTPEVPHMLGFAKENINSTVDFRKSKVLRIKNRTKTYLQHMLPSRLRGESRTDKCSFSSILSLILKLLVQIA